MSFLKLYRSQRIQQSDRLPIGVKLIAWTRATRWAGWGFGEALIPIFVAHLSKSFAEAGMLRATYDLTLLLSLPIIGALADRAPAMLLIHFALILYPFVGLSYFLAGILNAAVFILIARGLNGFLWGLENVGVSTFYRRITPSQELSSSFGYIDTWSNFGWIVPALLSMYLVSIVPIHWLLLTIAPAALLALIVARRAPWDRVSPKSRKHKTWLIDSYRKILLEWRTWDRRLWSLSFLIIFSTLVEALMWFFIPIDAYIHGTQPVLVILLSVVAVIPRLFGYVLGRLADTGNKPRLISIGLLCVAIVATGLSIFPQFAFKLLASFSLGVLLELFVVIQKNLITTLGRSNTFGRRDSAFESVATLGNLFSTLAIGVGIDLIGFSHVSAAIAALGLILSATYASGKLFADRNTSHQSVQT